MTPDGLEALRENLEPHLFARLVDACRACSVSLEAMASAIVQLAITSGVGDWAMSARAVTCLLEDQATSRPDFAALCPPRRFLRPAHDVHRLRSMQKPTGMPWDRRR